MHLVWATKSREPLLDPAKERPVFRCVEGEARRLGCDVLAVNGMPDHMHLLVKMSTRLSVAALMHRVKGGSSHFTREQLADGGNFGWQEGYGVFSVGRNQVAKVIAYIQNQKRHHAEGTCHALWEEVDEEASSPVRRMLPAAELCEQGRLARSAPQTGNSLPGFMPALNGSSRL